MYKLIFSVICLGTSINSGAQTLKSHDFSSINPAEWVIPKNDSLDFTFENFEGMNALILKRKILNSKSASTAYPKNLEFRNGIIECDIASPEGPSGYIGLAFRIMDAHHYETIYFRPGGSGTMDAVQYMPEKKLEFDWWDYENAKYQAIDTLPLKTWFHVKVVVKENSMTVYTGNKETPVYTYNDLDAGITRGSVGFWLGNCRSGAFKNLIVRM
jgi:hypothetical protein